jgi:hypothetical protein
MSGSFVNTDRKCIDVGTNGFGLEKWCARANSGPLGASCGVNQL